MNLAILIQGPKTQWTHSYIRRFCELNFVKHVRYSGWRGQEIDFRHPKYFWTYSDDVRNPGIGNRNRQIYSSFNGIKNIPKCFDTVLKIRSDMYLPHLSEMLDFYQTYKTEPDLKKSIFVLSIYPIFPFHPRDHVFLGTNEQIYRLFDIPLDPTPTRAYNECKDIRSETYIGMHYYKQFDNTVCEMTKSPETYLTDIAPKRKEAIKIYYKYLLKGFFPCPAWDIEWLKYYKSGYPFDKNKKLYKETFFEDLNLNLC